MKSLGEGGGAGVGGGGGGGGWRGGGSCILIKILGRLGKCTSMSLGVVSPGAMCLSRTEP